MPKASIQLPDGTSVVIDGSPEEIARILELYGGSNKPTENTNGGSFSSKRNQSTKSQSKRKKKTSSDGESKELETIDLVGIIETIRNCDEAEAIETQILDKSGQVNRILLPLYIVHEYYGNSIGLTSGDVSKITTDLGVPVQTPNASRTLSGTASRYVIGDSVRKKGQPVRYKLSRRGVQFIKEVISGGVNGK